MNAWPRFVYWVDNKYNHYPSIMGPSQTKTKWEWWCKYNERLVTGSDTNGWLELFHRPTDSRLDYCRCGGSWPCKRRRRWEQRKKGTCTVSKKLLYSPIVAFVVGYAIGIVVVIQYITKEKKR